MCQSKGDEETILKSVRFHIHLISSESTANPDVVLAANHVERVRDVENVGPPLEGSKPAITQVPVITHECRSHAAADAVFGGLVDDTGRSVRALGIKICAQDAREAEAEFVLDDVSGLACPVSK